MIRISRRGRLLIVVVLALVTIPPLLTLLVQRKCYADNMTYALGFDCGQPKELVRFLLFSKPTWFPKWIPGRPPEY